MKEKIDKANTFDKAGYPKKLLNQKSYTASIPCNRKPPNLSQIMVKHQPTLPMNEQMKKAYTKTLRVSFKRKKFPEIS